MKKIVRLTGTPKLMQNESTFKNSAKKLGGVDIDFCCYMGLFYQDGFKYLQNNNPLKDYDVYWVGGVSGVSMRQGLVYHYGVLNDKIIVDESKKNTLGYDKFSQIVLLDKLGYNHPENLFFVIYDDYIDKQVELVENNFSFPVIAKEVDKDRGTGVYLFENSKDLKNFFSKNHKTSILIQEYIENTGDYRILVIGDKVIGSFKRYNKDSFKNNVSSGGETTIEELPQEIYDIAIDITKNIGFQISGVDIFYENGKYNVIEINELPQYDGFEKATGISYSYEVLKFLKNF